MLKVLRLVQSLRFSLRDMQGVKVSDFELIEAINQAASLLYIQMSEKYVRYGMKKDAAFRVGSTGYAMLPVDFIKIHQVGMGEDGVAVPTSYLATTEGTYRIIGDTFYAPSGIYGLEYYYVPVRVSSLDDELDVPEAMSPYIEQISLAIYGNNLDKAANIVSTCVTSLSDREVSHFENVGPVQVLGGRV